MFLEKKKQKLKLAGLVVIAIVALLFGSAPVLASQIHFDIDSPTTGTISWAGGDSPLIGTDIQVDQVIGLDTPANNNVLQNISSGLLNFETGAKVSFVQTGDEKKWTFAGGGSLSITGTVDLPDPYTDATDNLMSGEFLYSGTVNLVNNLIKNRWFITFASFTDTKNADLIDYYGMPDGPYTGALNISFVDSNDNGNDNDLTDGFTSSSVLSGDISNHLVPIPASVLLLGSGLVGLIGFGKRRMRKRLL